MLQKSDFRLYALTMSASLTFMMNGIFVSWTSPMLPWLIADDSPVRLDSSEISWVVALLATGIIIAPIPAGILAIKFGRKSILLCSTAPALLSLQLASVSDNVYALYLSRIVAGISVGMSMTTSPLYLGEVARESNRGMIGTITHVFNTAGSLIAYSVGPYVGYRYFQLVCSVVPLLFIVTIVWMPESPIYLLEKGYRHEASVALAFIRKEDNLENVEQELKNMQQYINNKRTGTLRDLIYSRGNRKGLVIMIVIVNLMLLSGHGVVMSFAGMIFRKSGSSIDADISGIILGLVQTLMSVVTIFLVDRIGRRPLLFISCVGCSASMVVEGFYFFLKASKKLATSDFDWIPLVFLIIFLIVYNLGLGSLTSTLISELFPLHVKGIAASIVIIFGGICSLVVTKAYLVIASKLGVHISFWGSAAFCAFGAIFIALYVPETKGKSLLEITNDLNGFSGDNEKKISLPAGSVPENDARDITYL